MLGLFLTVTFGARIYACARAYLSSDQPLAALAFAEEWHHQERTIQPPTTTTPTAFITAAPQAALAAVLAVADASCASWQVHAVLRASLRRLHALSRPDHFLGNAAKILRRVGRDLRLRLLIDSPLKMRPWFEPLAGAQSSLPGRASPWQEKAQALATVTAFTFEQHDTDDTS